MPCHLFFRPLFGQSHPVLICFLYRVLEECWFGDGVLLLKFGKHHMVPSSISPKGMSGPGEEVTCQSQGED